MKLRNGTKFTQSKQNELETVDKNIVRHVGMHRLPSKQKTPFQELLNTIIRNNYALNDPQFSEIIKKTLSIPSLKDNEKMFSSEDSDIINAYNDNSRRYFESLLAKKILDNFGEEKSPLLKSFILELKNFLLTQYTKNHTYVKAWNLAQAGKQVKDANLSHYALLRRNLLVLIKDGHFGDNDLLLDSFDLHYLTHSLSKLNNYKTFHPTGYVKSYTENSHFYSGEERGRINGFGFNHEEPSFHLGIMRSIDKTPYDMRRPKLISSETRCPDRLYMVHPREARHDSKNWLHQAFANPHNSLYVNGLSGSILLEINALLFLMKAIQINLYKPRHLTYDQISQENFKVLKDYLLMISSVFVYFEGGHTLTEIMSVFDLDTVTNSIQTVLGEPKGTFSLKDFMLSNPAVYPLIQESLIETAKYQARQDNLGRVHHQLLQNKAETIQTILDSFKLKIDSIGTHYPYAKEKAKSLLFKLEHLSIEVLKNPTDKALNNFRNKADDAIKESIPILQKDLGWGDYLLNLLKQITNVLINFFTFGTCKNHSLFAPPKVSQSEEIARNLSTELHQ